MPWQNGLFEDGLRAAGVSGVEVGTKLHITNLDQGVTNEDIRVQSEFYILCFWFFRGETNSILMESRNSSLRLGS